MDCGSCLDSWGEGRGEWRPGRPMAHLKTA